MIPAAPAAAAAAADPAVAGAQIIAKMAQEGGQLSTDVYGSLRTAVNDPDWFAVVDIFIKFSQAIAEELENHKTEVSKWLATPKRDRLTQPPTIELWLGRNTQNALFVLRLQGAMLGKSADVIEGECAKMQSMMDKAKTDATVDLFVLQWIRDGFTEEYELPAEDTPALREVIIRCLECEAEVEAKAGAGSEE